MDYSLRAPVPADELTQLRAGDVVRLSGTLYTARDAAHARFRELLQRGEELRCPGCCVYYAGPCPPRRAR